MCLLSSWNNMETRMVSVENRVSVRGKEVQGSDQAVLCKYLYLWSGLSDALTLSFNWIMDYFCF